MNNERYLKGIVFGAPSLFVLWLGINEFMLNFDGAIGSIAPISSFLLSTFSVFFAGAYMKGPSNRSVVFAFAMLIILNQYLYYGLYHYLPGSGYISVSLGAIGFLPTYLYFTFRGVIHYRIGNYFPALAKHFPIRTTNFAMIMFQYVKIGMIIEVAYMVYMWGVAAYYQVPLNGYISDNVPASRELIEPVIKDTIVSTIDYGLAILLIIKTRFDWKAPDATGFGHTLTYVKVK